MKKGDKEISIYIETLPAEVRDKMQEIQQNMGVEFEQSYEIMADACLILSDKTLDGTDRDGLNSDNCDFFADADSNANVYTSTQLSYLNNNNEGEISSLMKDEAIESIAQACSIWYSQKVAEACETLRNYINQ